MNRLAPRTKEYLRSRTAFFNLGAVNSETSVQPTPQGPACQRSKLSCMNPREDQPRLTIRTMTDYLTATGAHQRFTILENMRNQLGRRRFAPYYQRARMAIRAFHSGTPDALNAEIARLLRQLRDESRPSEIGKVNGNLRVLTDYDEHFADEPLVHEGGQFEPLVIHGVRISTEPTLTGTISAGRGRRMPCNVIVDTQAEAPDGAEIDFVLELLHRGSGQTHPCPPRGAQYWHPGSGDSWTLTSPSVRRWRDIEAACREVALRWPTIQS